MEVSSKAVQVLVIWKQGMGLGLVEVDVPDSQESQDHRDLRKEITIRMIEKTSKESQSHVLVEWGRSEVLVNVVSPGEQLLKVVEANVEGNGHPDGRPKRVPSEGKWSDSANCLRCHYLK